nr:hypothetical protein CTI12_AA250730 [Tanacetum cinerariifolium]
MDMTIDQQVALDEALVPYASRLRIGKSNFRLRSDITSKESTLQLVYDVLRLTPFYKAFLVTADVPEIYMQEFWATATVHHHSIRFKMDNKKRIVNLEYFREMMHICPRLPGLKYVDRPDVISRVVKIKLDCLMKELNDGHIFGRVKGVVYTIEFQKRGLPYCHILLWLETKDKITTTRKIDEYISAEIPNKDEDPDLYQLVTDHMMHGPCGADNPSCPCTIKYKCTKKFPRQFNETVIDDSGYALYRRRNNGNIIKKSGTDLHNGYVVPYNPGLVSTTVDGEEVDEIKDFLNCRYMSACEAAWRIYGFEIHYRTPSVERLPFHLKDEYQVIFDAIESIDYVVDKSSINETKFESWMELNQTDTFARTLLYVEIPKFYDDKEYIDGILEAILWGMDDYLRSIFFMLIMTDSMSRPEIVWEKTWMKLVEDVLNVERIKQGIPETENLDTEKASKRTDRMGRPEES